MFKQQTAAMPDIEIKIQCASIYRQRCGLLFRAPTLLVGDMKGIQPVKNLHQNPLGTVVDISEWGTG